MDQLVPAGGQLLADLTEIGRCQRLAHPIMPSGSGSTAPSTSASSPLAY
jgi:hypothetical protein